MTTPGQDAARAAGQGTQVEGEPGGGAMGPGSGPPRGAGARTPVLAALVAGLGFAAGSWAAPPLEEATPDQAPLEWRAGLGCAEGLPPGHPTLGTMPRELPPGHPPSGPCRGSPRPPAGPGLLWPAPPGHRPHPATPPLLFPLVRTVTI